MSYLRTMCVTTVTNILEPHYTVACGVCGSQCLYHMTWASLGMLAYYLPFFSLFFLPIAIKIKPSLIGFDITLLSYFILHRPILTEDNRTSPTEGMSLEAALGSFRSCTEPSKDSLLGFLWSTHRQAFLVNEITWVENYLVISTRPSHHHENRTQGNEQEVLSY